MKLFMVRTNGKTEIHLMERKGATHRLVCTHARPHRDPISGTLNEITCPVCLRKARRLIH